MFSVNKLEKVATLVSKFSCITRGGSLTCNAATKVMRKPAILYHYPCPDGAFAALAAHLYFSSLRIAPLYFPNTVYSPTRYIASSTPSICFLLFFPVIFKGIIFFFLFSVCRVEDLPLNQIDHVYLLDFVGPSGFVQQLKSKVEW